MGPILLVEDNPNDVLLIRDTLDQLNLVNKVAVATSAEAARIYMTNHPPALIISDVYLPGDTGIDLLHWLRDQPLPLGNTPVIMLSGSTERVHQLQASALRALLFLSKPIKQDVLLDAIRGLGLLVTHLPQGERAGVMIEYRTH
jgi:two-component system response regulator